VPRQNLPRLLPRLAAIASIAGLVLVAPLASLATAAPADVTILGTAGLHARGAAIAVQVSVTCSSGLAGSINVELSQRVSSSVVRYGSSAAPVVCDDSAHRIRIGIVPRDQSTGALGGPFKVGPAFVTASVSVCSVSCVDASDVRTVDVQSIILNSPRVTTPSLTAWLPPTGTVEAAGAGVVVRLFYRCSSGVVSQLFGSLVQRTPNDTLMTATAKVTPLCDGLSHGADLAFHAPGQPWHVGAAFLSLYGSACDADACSDPRAFRTVTLK